MKVRHIIASNDNLSHSSLLELDSIFYGSCESCHGYPKLHTPSSSTDHLEGDEKKVEVYVKETRFHLTFSFYVVIKFSQNFVTKPKNMEALNGYEWRGGVPKSTIYSLRTVIFFTLRLIKITSRLLMTFYRDMKKPAGRLLSMQSLL